METATSLAELDDDELDAVKRYAYKLNDRNRSRFETRQAHKTARKGIGTTERAHTAAGEPISDGDVLWITHYGILFMAGLALLAATVPMSFLIVPFVLSYSLTFFTMPLFQLLTRRPPAGLPPACERCCRRQLRASYRIRLEGHSVLLGLIDLLLLGKLPAGLAAVIVIWGEWALLVLVGSLVGGSLEEFFGGSGDRVMASIETSVGSAERWLNKSGVILDVHLADIGYTPGKGWSMAAVGSLAGVFGDFFNQAFIVWLYQMYIMMELNSSSVLPGGDTKLVKDIDKMMRQYVAIKTVVAAALSIVTFLVFSACHVKVPFIWALLAMVLHFVPYLSAFGAILPVPIILFDPDINWAWKGIAMGLVTFCHLVAGFSEDRLIPSARSLSAVPMLVSLVTAYAFWGVTGAMVCVPLVDVLRRVLREADHPLSELIVAGMTKWTGKASGKSTLMNNLMASTNYGLSDEQET